MTLVDKETRKPLKQGQEVTTFRGDKGTLTGWRAPDNAGSSGRVWVDRGQGVQEYFPSVIGAEFIEE
jgi:hypothetical protein